jgi:hypothetical protein
MSRESHTPAIRKGYRRTKDVLEPLRPVYDAWMKLIAGFSWLLARVLLTVLFFTAFVGYSVALTAFRRDPMRRNVDEDRSSYWGDNVVSNDGVADYEKLY